MAEQKRHRVGVSAGGAFDKSRLRHPVQQARVPPRAAGDEETAEAAPDTEEDKDSETTRPEDVEAEVAKD